MDSNDGNEDSKSSELLFETKNKNKARALKLINEGANIHFRDQTKCTVLHYAAQAGYDELIIKIISMGGNVKLWDCNDETPLHKAARAGNETTVVILVANGSDIDALNSNGRNPLQLAVEKKHVKVVNVLSMCGADLVMENWTLVEDVMRSKNKNDQSIMDILNRLSDRSAGFRHGGILYSMKQIETNKEATFDKLGLELQANKSSTTFCFYCCKLHAEYADVLKQTQYDKELFSDVYECRTWGGSHKVFTLVIKIEAIPKCNETLEIVSPEGKIGRIDSSLKNEEKNYTEVTVTITIKPNTTTTFMLVTVEKPEIFAITKDAVKIQPQMEPDAEIDIPKGTFDTPGDLLFNVVETKDVNINDTESNETAVLLTNVLDLSMSNRQQPNHPIDMKLPIHANTSDETDIVVLASSKEYPEEIEDWEIVDASKDKRRGCASFQIRHFSIFTGVSKLKVANDMLMVTRMIQTALNNERQVEFFVLVKTLSKTEYAVVVECALQRKSKQRRRYWRKKGYEAQDVESMPCTVQINSWFRVMFGGNIKRQGTEKDEGQKLMFNPNRENFQIYSIEVVDYTNPPIGNMKIELITEKEQEPIQVVGSGTGCRGGKTTYIPRDPIEEFYELTRLPIHLKPPDDGETIGQSDHQYDGETIGRSDHQCTIPVLKMTSLMQLYRRLNVDEVHHLAIQLKVDLSTENLQGEDLLDTIFWKWRGHRPYHAQVEFLINALERMDKIYEADAFRMADISDTEVRFE